jgi:DNA-binding PadR family transcriptional regulator
MNRSPDELLPFTTVEFEILLSLAGGDLHGYAILQDVEARTQGRLSLRPGTLYRAISRLLDHGLISELAETQRSSGDPRRRTYHMTAEGRRLAAREAERLARQVTTARARRVLKRGEA